METSLYVREQATSATGRSYYKFSRIREGKGVKTGSLTGPFYIRPSVGGRQRWHKLNAKTFQQAKAEGGLGAVAIDAQRQGLTVAEAESIIDANRVLISTAIDRYLDKKRKKEPSTLKNYSFILKEFLEHLAESGETHFIDQIDGEVLNEYMRWLEEKEAAPKTIENKIMCVSFMLKEAGVKNPSKLVEHPTIEEEVAEPYTKEDLKKLFAEMKDDAEENLPFTFFLDTACREKEVAHATWDDVAHGKYHVRAKTYTTSNGTVKKFKPKTHQARVIPLTRELADRLEERRKTSKSRWIFPNENGDPEGHFLRKFKAIAKRAGLNCGHCHTELTEGRYVKRKIQVTCKTRPTCDRHYLHRLRKTTATFWHEGDISLRTIQTWLGHKSLETTQKYLGIKDSAELQNQINKPKY